MTAVPTLEGTSSACVQVPGALIDSLIESVVLPPDPLARSAVICDLVSELCAAVEWLHVDETTLVDAASPEVASLRQLMVAAKDHQLRMRAFGADGAANGGQHELV